MGEGRKIKKLSKKLKRRPSEFSVEASANSYFLISNELKQLANPEYAQKYQRYFKTQKGEYGAGDIFLGISVPDLRRVAKKYMHINVGDLQKLIHSKYHELRLIALILLVEVFERSSSLTERTSYFQFYVDHLKHINNWDLVDVSAPKIIGSYLADKNRAVLYDWVQSEHLWTRRVAVVSTLHFIRAGDLKDSLALSQLCLNDSHDLIHKAAGWILRECGKKNQSALLRFLDRHHQNMPRVMLRYAIERLTPQTRRHYMRNDRNHHGRNQNLK